MSRTGQRNVRHRALHTVTPSRIHARCVRLSRCPGLRVSDVVRLARRTMVDARTSTGVQACATVWRGCAGNWTSTQPRSRSFPRSSRTVDALDREAQRAFDERKQAASRAARALTVEGNAPSSPRQLHPGAADRWRESKGDVSTGTSCPCADCRVATVNVRERRPTAVASAAHWLHLLEQRLVWISECLRRDKTSRGSDALHLEKLGVGSRSA